VSIHFDRWAGLSVGETLLSRGPEELAERIARAEVRETLLDDAWCEGAVLLDRDARLLLFHTIHGPLQRSHGLRRAFVALLRQDWPGWTIRWAVRDLAEIVEHLGTDPAGLIEDRAIEHPATAERITRQLGIVTSVLGQPVTTAEYRRDAASTPYDKSFTPPNEETVLTVRFADGRLRDFSIGWGPAGDLLSAGPDLVTALADHPGHSLPNEFFAGAGAFIDLPANRVSAWPPPRRPGLDVPDGRWPGFDIRWHDDGLPGQAEQSGRDPGTVRLTPHMLIWQGIELLNPWDTKETQARLEAIAAGLDAGGTDPHGAAGTPEDEYRSFLTRLAGFGSTA
jgi:hypothetical protein